MLVSSFTVVQNFSTYWVKLSSSPITVVPVAPGVCLRQSYSIELIKSHGRFKIPKLISLIHPPTPPPPPLCFCVGCVMCLAWGLLAPVGILIALFYKVVWPNGEWFYVSIRIHTSYEWQNGPTSHEHPCCAVTFRYNDWHAGIHNHWTYIHPSTCFRKVAHYNSMALCYPLCSSFIWHDNLCSLRTCLTRYLGLLQQQLLALMWDSEKLLHTHRVLSFVFAAIHGHSSLWPHQPMVLWHAELSSVVLNFLPPCCRRWVYNWTHGITGLLLGQVAACNS